MTGLGSTEVTIESMRMGAYDYIAKPFDIQDIQTLVEKALSQGRLMQDITIQTEAKESQTSPTVQKIIGNSAVMQTLYKMVGKVAASNVPILIHGESGTGKELVARAIYNYSDRKDKTFLAVNCAAIPETLLESELFGYEKGAFTGAHERRIGKFEQCHGGTLFLDEIGDMPLLVQAKLLRVLQNGDIERLGSNQTIKVDVRIISATHKDLEKAIHQNMFREDLFYRLNVVKLSIPPLRERREDIPLLVDYFVRRFSHEQNKNIIGIPESVMEKLQVYGWPGNIRELENVIKRAVVLNKDNVLREDDVILGQENMKGDAPAVSIVAVDAHETSLGAIVAAYAAPMLDEILKLPSDQRLDLLPRLEAFLLPKTLNALHHNQLQTAKLLGMTRNTLRSRVEELEKAS
jgi:DNA-binding NtrC family response regulator